MDKKSAQRSSQRSINYEEIERISPEFDECAETGHTIYEYDNICFCGAFVIQNGLDKAIQLLDYPNPQLKLKL